MIFLGADFRGFELKEKIKSWLTEWDEEYQDLGNRVSQPGDDFPDYAIPVAQAVVKNQALGIVICGTGAGVTIAANKVKGVYCALGMNEKQVIWAKKADQVNVLALAAEFITDELAQKMVKAFIKTDFGQEKRYLRRFKKVNQLEEGSFK